VRVRRSQAEQAARTVRRRGQVIGFSAGIHEGDAGPTRAAPVATVARTPRNPTRFSSHPPPDLPRQVPHDEPHEFSRITGRLPSEPPHDQRRGWPRRRTRTRPARHERFDRGCSILEHLHCSRPPEPLRALLRWVRLQDFPRPAVEQRHRFFRFPTRITIPGVS
jgi:hypothetical protein